MGLDIGHLYVRRSAFVEAAPARVWQAFTSFESIAAWLNRGHTLHKLEPEPGGEVDFSIEIDSEQQHFGGRVVIVEPERELSMAINWESAEMASPVDLYWTFRITGLNNGTLVELFHHGFDVLDDAADQLEGYESGWTSRHLVALREIVLGS